ncbi:MAG: helix-turn-helix domain-containing protein [Bacillota bacterium]|nr:helix-turn-helix domain-containing protein [Bacillota bacterium]
MVYYQVLKQRRIDLQVSIEDISSQTRLAPQYIEAIEENNLDIFTGDFDFVRRFVKSYAETIGVNWEYIKDDVELNISRYIQMKINEPSEQIVLKPSAEMYDIEEEVPSFKQAPKKAAPKTSAKKKSGKKKGKKVSGAKKKSVNIPNVDFQQHAKKVVKWTKASRRRFLIAVAVGIGALLLGANMVLSKISSEQNAAQDSARQAELKAKEEETAKLANQKKATSKKTAQEEAEKNKLESQVESDSIITNTDAANNIYQITNLIETDQRLTIEIVIPEETKIAVYQDDTPINDTEAEYTKLYSESFTIDHTCLIQLEISNYQENEIIINGQKITFDTSLWYEGEPAVIYLEIKTNDGAGSNGEEQYYDAYIEEEEEEE